VNTELLCHLPLRVLNCSSAKRVFLQYLGSVPHQLTPAPNSSVTLTPYKGPDGQAIIAHTQRGPRSERANSVASQDASIAFTTGNVSPAVSMMLMAAAAATGPPGTLGGSLNGTHIPNYPTFHQQQQFNGNSFPASYASNNNIPSSFSQGSLQPLSDTFSFGYSMSGPLNGSMSFSSSWSDSSSSLSSNRASGRSGSLSFQPSGIPLSRSGLEDIAEASSCEELPHSQMASRSASVAPDNATNIMITESTPVLDADLERQQTRAMEGSGAISPHGKTRSDTEQSALPWLSRDPSPTPSLPTLHTQLPLDELVEETNRLMIQDRHPVGEGGDLSSESEKLSENAYNRGISTPPDGTISPGKTATPPRVGNPAKRMLGAALGIRHPSLPPRVITGATSALK
jgi:hypothetical protein